MVMEYLLRTIMSNNFTSSVLGTFAIGFYLIESKKNVSSNNKQIPKTYFEPNYLVMSDGIICFDNKKS